MVRKINNRLYKINTYASAHIIEIDDNYDEEVQKLRKEIPDIVLRTTLITGFPGETEEELNDLG